MSNQSQYLGSQAFNQTLIAEEFVVRNTGSLSLSKELVNLRGIAKAVNLNISLSYSAGTTGLLGLPMNWGFGISFLVPGESLSSQGRTYIIDPDWSDATGYQSGLRYVNDHGMRFTSTFDQQKLPSGQGEYSFMLTYNDGSRDFYDATGKLVEHDDLFGNHITYFYTAQIANIFGNTLDHIIDSFGQKVTFGYGPNSIVITTPDESHTTINFSAQGVNTVKDPLGNVTVFGYLPGQTLVDTIEYPTGLTTRLFYQPLVAGGQTVLQAVSDQIHLASDGSILEHTRYAFGTDSGGNNFTGGFEMSSTADNLMDSNNEAYIYDVLVSKLDAEGNLLTASRAYYNFLHLPVREEHYRSGLNNGYRALYSYQIALDFARSPNYARPILVQQFAYSPSASDYIPLRQSTATYDNFGQILSSEESLFDPPTQSWVIQLTSAKTYLLAMWGGEMPQSDIYVDEVSGFQRKLAFTLTADEKSIATAAVLFRGDAQSGWSPWKTKTFTYDSIGRIVATNLAWSPGSNVVLPGSITSTTTTTAYAFEPTTSTYMVSNTDALGNTTTRSYAAALATGPLTQVTTPLGATTTYTYDALGRATKVTDAEGNSSTTVYALSASSGSNSAVTTGPTGYLVAIEYDAMGRAVKTMDNGDPTKSGGTMPNRTLVQSSYDGCGNVTQVTDELGLTTTYVYDSFNRRVQSTDPLGNVSVALFDDGARTVSYATNGVLRRVTQLDGLGQTTSVQSYADPSDAPNQYSLLHQISYNGFGLTIGVQLSSIPNGGAPEILCESSFVHDVEAKIATEVYVGNLSTQVTVSRTTTYDLFGNAVSFQKETTYSDGRSFQVAGSIRSFDVAGRLVSVINQLGQVESYNYYGDGQMQTLTRFDGTMFSYDYDKVGRLSQMSWSGGSVAHTYLPNGQLQSTTLGDAVLRYSYYLDGSAQSITYPDGRTQEFGLDPVSRVVRLTDPSGAVTTTTFDSFGRIAQRQHSGDSIAYLYGTVNHVSGICTGDSLTGTASLSRQVSYDGFGQISSTVVTNASGQVILKSNYDRDQLGRLATLGLTSAIISAPSANLTRQLNYDGMNQLVRSVTTYGDATSQETVSYLYDGNFNITSRSDDATSQTFAYNAIDQLTTAGAVFDANGRMTLDSDGGRKYTYNMLDQLTAVAASDGPPLITYTYHPDGSLASTTSNQDILTFYYDGGIVNAIAASTSENDPNWTTFLLDSFGRRAAYEAGTSPSYYFASSDSTALLLQNGSPIIAFAYEPYGAVSNGVQVPANKTFAWNQEYADAVSQLVYLRARYYNPTLMRFMTMDSLNMDNRYAYCVGDPLNLIDPTGRLGVLKILGLVGGALLTVALPAIGIALGPLAAATMFGTEVTAASLAATTAGTGMIGGAFGSAAGDLVSTWTSGQQPNWSDALGDFVSGLLSGLIAGGGTAWLAAKGTSRVALGLIVGVTTSGASTVASDVVKGQQLISWNTLTSLLTGAAFGALTGRWVFTDRFKVSGAVQGTRSLTVRPELPSNSSISPLEESRNLTQGNEVVSESANNQIFNRSRTGVELPPTAFKEQNSQLGNNETVVHLNTFNRQQSITGSLFGRFAGVVSRLANTFRRRPAESITPVLYPEDPGRNQPGL